MALLLGQGLLPHAHKTVTPPSPSPTPPSALPPSSPLTSGSGGGNLSLLALGYLPTPDPVISHHPQVRNSRGWGKGRGRTGASMALAEGHGAKSLLYILQANGAVTMQAQQLLQTIDVLIYFDLVLASIDRLIVITLQ